MNIALSKKWTICKHHPEGFVEPYKCGECEDEQGTEYQVVKVTNNTLRLVSNGREIKVVSKEH
jgi:hypothetical protein